MDEILKAIEEIKASFAQIETKSVDLEEFKAMREAVNQLQVSAKQGIFNPNLEKKSKYFDGQRAAIWWRLNTVSRIEKKSIDELATELYAEKDPALVEEFKALAAGGNTGTLIEEQWFDEVIPLLYPKLSFMMLGAMKVPMPKGNMLIRKMVSGSSAQWIGESEPIGASEPRFGALKLLAKKLRVKVPYSNDLLRSTSINADRLILDDMIMQLKVAMDLTFYYGRGTQHEPLGVANTRGITNLGTKTDVIDGDTMYKDYVQPLKEADIPMQSCGWAFPPRVYTQLYNEQFESGRYKYRDELLRGTFHGYKFVETNQIATRDDGATEYADVFFGDYAQAFVGEQVSLEVKEFDQAYYLDADGERQSASDNDETVVQGLMICDMGILYGKAWVKGEEKIN